jgi:hypothetical protein
MLHFLRRLKKRSTYAQWQRSLWVSLLVWWCIGTMALVVLKQNYQLEWAMGCLLGVIQAVSLNWAGNQIKTP